MQTLRLEGTSLIWATPVGSVSPWGWALSIGFAIERLFCIVQSTNVVHLKSPSKKKRVVRREAEVLGMREDLQQFFHRVSLVNGSSPFNDTLSTPLVQTLDYLLRVLMSVGVDFIAGL